MSGDRELSEQVAARAVGEDVRDRVARVLTRHRRTAEGIVAWRCSCGHEGDDLPEAHLADVLYDAGLLKEDT